MKRIHDDSGFHAAAWLALAAFGAHAAFLFWAFLQAGTLGMYRWGHSQPVVLLATLGILPLALLAGLALTFRKRTVPAAGTVVLSAVAVLSLLGAIGTGLFVLSNAYGKPVDEASRPIMLDPSAGLQAPDGRGLRVFISSDPHVDRDVSDHARFRDILGLAQEERSLGRLDAFMVLGDLVEMGMYKSGWDIALAEFHAHAPDVPFLSIMGNHDALIGGTARWKAAFGPAGAKADSPGPSWWRLDAGRVHFIGLGLLWGPEGFGAREKAWLLAQLDSIPKDHYTVVLCHSYLWASGYKDAETGMEWYDHPAMLAKVAPLLEGRADLVVSGHNHFMEWLQTEGTAWAIVGAMGGVPDPEPDYRSPHSRWIKREAFGVLALELGDEGLVCSFLDHEGRPLHTAVIQ